MKSATYLFGFLSLAPMLAAGPLPCIPGTLASYIALGASGCAVGNIEFVNFGYASKAGGGAPEIAPDLIQVNPVLLGLPEAASFAFSAKWQATAGQSQESLIQYTVIVTSFHSSGSLTLTLGIAQAGQPGVVVVRENTSVGGTQVYLACAQNCRSKTTDTLDFTPVPGSIRVVNQVRLSSTNGSSSLEGFTALVNLCPKCV
jgi:hypothetical protein